MSYKILKKEKSSVEVELTVSTDLWEKSLEDAYEANKGRFNVQGFRKGKAPRKVIEQTYGAGVFFDEAMERAFNEEYGAFLDAETEIEPIDHPEVEVKKFDEKGMVIFAKAPTMPEVELGEYKGLTVEKSKEKIKKADVELELKKVQENRARFVESEEASAMGDAVTIDFAGSVDGKIFDGGTAQNYRLELGSKSFIEGFEEQLTGLKVGDEKDVNVTFPENYFADDLKGKPAIFKVVVNKVEKKQIPEINDSFASDVSEFETLEEYKADIEKRLNLKLEHEKEHKIENDLIEQIVKGSTVDVPEILVNRQLDMFMRDLETRLSYQGITMDDYLKYADTTIEKLREERKEQAKETAKTRLVLEEIVKKENLTVTDAELDEKLNEYAEKYKKSIEDYKKSLDARTIAYFQNDILMKKLLDFLKSNNNIK